MTDLTLIPDAVEFPPNAAMLASIDEAVATARDLTAAERTFLDFELLVADHVSRGLTVEEAHELARSAVPAGSNYAPDVMRNHPTYFSETHFAYWGITP